MIEKYLPASIAALVAGFLMVFVIIVIASYVYFALALMAIAKRTNTPNAWLAWIPIANMVLLAQIAKQHWWPVRHAWHPRLEPHIDI